MRAARILLWSVLGAAGLAALAVATAPADTLVDGCPALDPAGRDGYGGYVPVPRAASPVAQLRRKLRPPTDWADLCWYRDDNARLAARGERVRTVFFGDSLIALWRGFDASLFGDGLVNRGVPGQTSAHLMVRVGQDVIALGPDTVHILVGMNDAIGVYGALREEDFAANLTALIALARAGGARIVLGTVPVADDLSDTPHRIDPAQAIARLNVIIRAIARKQGLVLADYEAAMRGPDGRTRAGLLQPDGIHPSIAGYAVMSQVARAALAEATPPPPPPSPPPA